MSKPSLSVIPSILDEMYRAHIRCCELLRTLVALSRARSRTLSVQYQAEWLIHLICQATGGMVQPSDWSVTFSSFSLFILSLRESGNVRVSLVVASDIREPGIFLYLEDANHNTYRDLITNWHSTFDDILRPFVAAWEENKNADDVSFDQVVAVAQAEMQALR